MSVSQLSQLAVVAVLSAASVGRAAEEPEFGFVFQVGKEDIAGVEDAKSKYAQYRAENVVVTNSGAIVVVCQGRCESKWSDRSGQDLLAKRSTDCGATWSKGVLVASHGEKSIAPNAAVYDRTTGRIHVLYNVHEWSFKDPDSRKKVEGPQCRQYQVTSDDEGRTWSKPRDISAMMPNPGAITIFGAGEGIQLRRGKRKGRLIVPGGDFAGKAKRVGAFYSDDAGKTWKYGAFVPCTAVESAIAELPDGLLIMNNRSHTGFRRRAFSRDGGETWTKLADDEGLPAVNCNASIITYTDPLDGEKPRLIYAGPVGPKRTNGTAFLSYDGGRRWHVRKLVVGGMFAYSSLARLPDGAIGLFYEADDYKSIKLARFTLHWLTDGRDALEKRPRVPRPAKGAAKGAAPARPAGGRIPQIDLSGQAHRRVIVDRIADRYLGQPDTVLLTDGKTILVCYPNGHGGPDTVLKRSADGGLTWSDRLPVPKSFLGDHNAPTIHRVTDPKGVERLILFVSHPVMKLSVSPDNGKTWSPLKPIFPDEMKGAPGYKGHAPPKSVVRLTDGRYLAMYHDHYTRDRKKVVESIQVISKDGGLTWSEPRCVTRHPLYPGAHPCEPGIIRSPDGEQLLCLLRENSRKYNSMYMVSNDEGATWSDLKEMSLALKGDRHIPRYTPDGRLITTIRDMDKTSPTYGDFVLWVGTYEDIIRGRDGQYRVRLLDNKSGRPGDTGYAGLVLLPDGTFVSTTYCVLTAGEQPLIVSVRFTMKELDAIKGTEH